MEGKTVIEAGINERKEISNGDRCCCRIKKNGYSAVALDLDRNVGDISALDIAGIGVFARARWCKLGERHCGVEHLAKILFGVVYREVKMLVFDPCAKRGDLYEIKIGVNAGYHISVGEFDHKGTVFDLRLGEFNSVGVFGKSNGGEGRAIAQSNGKIARGVNRRGAEAELAVVGIHVTALAFTLDVNVLVGVILVAGLAKIIGVSAILNRMRALLDQAHIAGAVVWVYLTAIAYAVNVYVSMRIVVRLVIAATDCGKDHR